MHDASNIHPLVHPLYNPTSLTHSQFSLTPSNTLYHSHTYPLTSLKHPLTLFPLAHRYGSKLLQPTQKKAQENTLGENILLV